MRLLLAALATMLPGLLHAQGYDPVVEIPCYPDNQFELCAVPLVDGHYPGYLPRTVPAVVTITVAGNRFAILVTPNVVPYELAVKDAAVAAAGYCGRDSGERVVARIDQRERYAEENLASWRFAGSCR